MSVSLPTFSDGAGPMPKQVTVLGGISVRPLSMINAQGKPSSFASLSSSSNSFSVFTLTAIFRCPSSIHACHHSLRCLFSGGNRRVPSLNRSFTLTQLKVRTKGDYLFVTKLGHTSSQLLLFSLLFEDFKD
jgi:hypothetical protein